MVREVCALFIIAICAPGLAYGNCARDVQDMAPKVQHIKDGQARQKAKDYLNRAKRELNENDEFECQTAIGAAQKLVDANSAEADGK